MSVQLFDLAQVFNKNFFRIPDYQRGYSWEEPQLSDFWMDLSELPDGKNHYVGVLNVEKALTENIKDPSDQWMINERKLNAFFVVDGQQRITTCIVAIKAMLDSKEDLGEEDPDEIEKRYLWLTRKGDGTKVCVFGYEKDNPSFEFWKSRILGIDSTSNDDIQTTYTRNLKCAYDFFVKKIAERQVPVKNLYAKLTSHFKFNFYEIDPTFDVHVTFETMNNRGKDLSKLELLKNRFIYLSSLLSHQSATASGDVITQVEIDHLRQDVNNVWKTVYEYLGKSSEIKLRDDDFLKHHWAMYFGFKKDQADEYAKFLLDEHFTAKKVITGEIRISDIKDYITSLQLSIKNWYKVLACDTNLSEEHEVLGNLNVIGHRYFMPLILAAYSKSNEHPPIQLLREIERYSFLAFAIYGRNSGYGQPKMMNWAHQLFKGKDSSGNTVAISNVISGIQYESESQKDVQKFKQEIASLFKDKEGFYSWTGIEYLLYRYELSLHKKSKETSTKIPWNSVKTIEHILPQENSDPYWKLRFGNLADIELNKALHSVGNLLLLNRRKNSSLSSKGFDLKRSMDKFGYSAGTLSENEVAINDDWTIQHILNRGILLMRFIETEWKVSFGNDTEIKKLLQLDFINDSSETTN